MRLHLQNGVIRTRMLSCACASDRHDTTYGTGTGYAMPFCSIGSPDEDIAHEWADKDGKTIDGEDPRANTGNWLGGTYKQLKCLYIGYGQGIISFGVRRNIIV